MTRIVLIRQRPSIGDCLLLSPLVEQLKLHYPDSTLTVITDAHYLGGALPTIFQGITGVDRIETIDSREWTTWDNRNIDPTLFGSATEPLPYTVRTADLTFNCNAAFMEFERAHQGLPPYGISEFWLRHHSLYTPDANLLPHYNVNPAKAQEIEEWLTSKGVDKPLVGIVLRSAHTARDWDYKGYSTQIAEWLHTIGYTPVGIDPIKTLESRHGFSCIGKPMDTVAALIKRCDLILTPDTGLLHLAQAVGTQQVALWGIMPPELRVKDYDCTVVPKESLGYCQASDKGCECAWQFQKWSCLRRITLSMIIEALGKRLAK